MPQAAANSVAQQTRNNYSGYPSHEIDPSKKDADWVLQYLRTMYAEWKNNSTNSLLNGNQYARFVKNRKYADGMQDVDQYKKLLDCDGDASYVNLDWSIVPIIPKFIDVIQGLMDKMGHNISSDAIDQLAKDLKKQKKHNMEAVVKLRDVLEELDKIAGKKMASPEEAGAPLDMEELELHTQINNFKLSVEIAMEEAIQAVLYLNSWDEAARQIRKGKSRR